MIFDRLAIGTANWGKEYNGAKVPEDDQKRILDYCREVGIDMIDTATAYEWDWTKIDPWFKVVLKVQGDESLTALPWCIMAHCSAAIDFCIGVYGEVPCWGISVYESAELQDWCPNVFEFPYSIYDRRLEPYFSEIKAGGSQIHVRSVFLRGKILEHYSPHDCITFCLMNPYVDRVILGADSYSQFVYNLAHFDGLCEAKKEDINLLDPRKWEEEK